MVHAIGRAVLVGWLVLGNPTGVAGQERMTSDRTAVWKSPVAVKEYRAVQRSGAQLDTLLPPRGSSVDAIVEALPLCTVEAGTRVAVVEAVEEQIVRILALDGRWRGCRGWIGSESLAP